MATPAGDTGFKEIKALSGPTEYGPAIDPKREFSGLSNPENAAFEGFAGYLTLTALRHVTRRQSGPSAETWAEVAEEYRRRNPILPLTPEQAQLIAELDDPHFEAKLHTAAAPLETRKALLVELWNSLGIEDRLRFLRRVAKPSELRSAAA